MMAIGKGKPADGHRGIPGANANDITDQVVKVIEPDPDPTVVEETRERWASAPDSDAKRRLDGILEEIELLEEQIERLGEAQVEAVLAGENAAEEEAIASQEAARQRRASRLRALPAAEEAVREETVTAWEAKLELLEVKIEEAATGVDAASEAWHKARRAEQEARQALTEADAQRVSLVEDRRRIQRRVRELRGV